MEKGSFQKSPLSRDSREFRDSRVLENLQTVENKRDSDHFLDSREFRDFRDSREFPLFPLPRSLRDKRSKKIGLSMANLR